MFFDSQTSSSCHKTQAYPIDPTNFSNFHNLSQKIEARNLMLNDQWPQAGCQDCQRIEAAGGRSERLYQLQNIVHESQVPPELLVNSQATSVTPIIVEAYFKNTCNLACIYCGPRHSSRWEQENSKFKEDLNSFNVTILENKDIDKMVDDFWKYLDQDQNYLTVKRYHILGGEPFLVDGLDQSIEFWREHRNPDLTINIVSNLCIPTDRFESCIDKFKSLIDDDIIWKLELTASLDGWGPEQEFVRYGLDLDLWEENFTSLIDKPWISLAINSTVSALTVKTMPTLAKKINEWNLVRPTDNKITQFFATTNSFDDIYAFGDKFFKDDLFQTLELTPEYNKYGLTAIINVLKNSTVNQDKLTDLKLFLDKLDYRRGTNWKKLFPWLVNFE